MPLSELLARFEREDWAGKAANTVSNYWSTSGATRVLHKNKAAIIKYAVADKQQPLAGFFDDHQQLCEQSDGELIRRISNNYIRSDRGGDGMRHRHVDERILRNLSVLVRSINNGENPKPNTGIGDSENYFVGLKIADLEHIDADEVAQYVLMLDLRETMNFIDAKHEEFLGYAQLLAQSSGENTGAAVINRASDNAQQNIIAFFFLYLTPYLQAMDYFRQPYFARILKNGDPKLISAVAQALTACAYEIDLWLQVFDLLLAQNKFSDQNEESYSKHQLFMRRYKQLFPEFICKTADAEVLSLNSLEDYTQSLLECADEMKNYFVNIHKPLVHPLLRYNYKAFLKNNWGKMVLSGLVVTALAAGLIALCILLPPTSVLLALPLIGKAIVFATPFVAKGITFLSGLFGTSLYAQIGSFVLAGALMTAAAGIVNTALGSMFHLVKSLYIAVVYHKELKALNMVPEKMVETMAPAQSLVIDTVGAEDIHAVDARDDMEQVTEKRSLGTYAALSTGEFAEEDVVPASLPHDAVSAPTESYGCLSFITKAFSHSTASKPLLASTVGQLEVESDQPGQFHPEKHG